MIIWFNCKITDVRLHPQFTVRKNLRTDDRLDIAKYSFASYAPLAPLVTKFIFNLELADACAGREQELESWIRSVLPEEKLTFNWHRVEKIQEWYKIKDIMDEIGDDLIFMQANEDHIFLDSSIDIFQEGLELIKADPDPCAVLMTSHYPESIRASSFFNGHLCDSKNYVTYTMVNNDAIRVLKKEYFEWYLNRITNPDVQVFRTENWNNISIVNNKLYVPTKEQFRHFDGYTHVQIGPEVCPSMEIPQGFFEGMTIRYGFNDRQDDAVNINPMAKDLYEIDPINGTDYRFTVDTLPAFWKSHIKQIVVADSIDERLMNQAYDTYLLSLSRIFINWHHVGAVFDDSNWPPATWINNHTKAYVFEE
jgi:hypothetical protein